MEMARLYPLVAEANDQNALALHFFLIGYHCQVLIASAVNPVKCPVRTLPELGAHIRAVLEYSAPGTPARVAGESMMRYYQQTLQATRNSLSARRAADLLYAAVRAAANANDADPSRKWTVPGLLAAGLDLEARKPQRPALSTLLRNSLGSVLGQKQKQSVEAIMGEIGGGRSKALVAISDWLENNAKAFWVPPSAERGTQPGFNGGTLTDAEYDVLAAIRRHAYHRDTRVALSTVKLKSLSGRDSAPRVLAQLRKLPQTKAFINARGSALFIRDAPPPPDSAGHQDSESGVQ